MSNVVTIGTPHAQEPLAAQQVPAEPQAPAQGGLQITEKAIKRIRVAMA